MSIWTQSGAITGMNLRTIPQRAASSTVVIVGMMCVVGVIISVLSLSTGFMQAVTTTGRPDRAVVFSQGAAFPALSSITRDNALTIIDAAGIGRSSDGKPLAMGEVYGAVPLKKKSNGINSFVTIYGIGSGGFAVRPEMKLVDGRMFEPARHEIIVGRLAQALFTGLEIGNKVTLQDGDWTIVGVFESDGSELESDLVTDANTMLGALRRPNFSTITAKLDSPAAFDQFKAALTSNPTLSVDVTRETEYLAGQAKGLSTFITSIAVALGALMGVGALFGALSTMYAAISARTVEIATLRAIGFSPVPIVLSVFIESLLLACIGAMIGSGLAWLAFNGDLHGVGGMVFRLRVTPRLIGEGVALAGAIGLAGALFPAIRAARLPVTAALQRR